MGYLSATDDSRGLKLCIDISLSVMGKSTAAVEHRYVGTQLQTITWLAQDRFCSVASWIQRVGFGRDINRVIAPASGHELADSTAVSTSVQVA